MTNPNDPVFPESELLEDEWGIVTTVNGLTVRHIFALINQHALLSGWNGPWSPGTISEMAVEGTDTLIAALNKEDQADD